MHPIVPCVQTVITLTISPVKNAQMVAQIVQMLTTAILVPMAFIILSVNVFNVVSDVQIVQHLCCATHAQMDIFLI